MLCASQNNRTEIDLRTRINDFRFKKLETNEYRKMKVDELVESHKSVTPAKAGVHNTLEYLDSRFRGNDKNGAKRTFYEHIKVRIKIQIKNR